MLETMISIFFPMFLLISAAALVSTRSGEVAALRVSDGADEVCSRLSATIDNVYFMGTGASAVLELPDKIEGGNYTAYVFGKSGPDNESFVMINASGTPSFCAMRADPVRHANGSTAFPVNGTVAFTNSNMTVVVS